MAQLIYGQGQSGVGELPYGLDRTAKLGCGWVAAYNALCLLGQQPDRQKVRRDLLMRGSLLGTMLPVPALYLQQLGHDVHFHARPGRFDRAVKMADVAVVWYRWRVKWRFGAHFITVRWDGQRFIAYNLYSNSQGETDLGGSFSDFLQKKHYRLPVVATVKRKK